jgi:hypothetical protein
MQLRFSVFQNFVVAAFAICAFAVTLSAMKLISAKCDVTNPESANFASPIAGRLAKLYPDINRPPYTPSPYGPLFYWTVRFATRLFGGQIEPARTAYRIFVFGSFLLLPVIVYLLLRGAAFSRVLSALGASASISFYYIPLFAATVRPDIPAICLSLVALWLVSHHHDASQLDIVLSAIVSTSAFMFKASYVAAPLSITALLVTQKRYKDLSIFAASGVISTFLFLAAIFHGEPMISQLLLVAKSPKDLHSAITLIHLYLLPGFGSLLLPAACAGFLLAMRSSDWRQRLSGYYFLFAVVIGFATLLQCGANVYYFAELWIAASLLLPAVLLKVRDYWIWIDWPLGFAACLALAFLFVQQTHSIVQAPKGIHDYNVAKLHSLHILSTDPYLTVQGRDPLLLDPYLNGVLENKHVWSPEPILTEIRQQSFDIVVIHEINHTPVTYRSADLISRTIQDELRVNYRPLCRTSAFVVLHPLRQANFTPEDATTVLAERCYADGDETF